MVAGTRVRHDGPGVTDLPGQRSAMTLARGRRARWLLVIGLLVGIVAMHALSGSVDSSGHPVGSRVEHAVTATTSTAATAQATAGVPPVSAWWSGATPLTGACGLCCAQPAAMCLAVLTIIGLLGLGATRLTARAVPPGSCAGGLLAATRGGLSGPPAGLLAHGTLLQV